MTQKSRDPVEELLQQVNNDPDKAEALRRALLTPELLTMPETLGKLLQATAIMAGTINEMRNEQNTLQETMTTQTRHLGRLAGREYEMTVALRVLGPIRENLHLDRIQLVCNNGLDGGATLRELLQPKSGDPDKLSQRELEDALLTDLVFQGTRAGEDMLVAVEASITAQMDDVHRARRRASLIAKATGKRVFAVAAGESCDAQVARLNIRQSGPPEPAAPGGREAQYVNVF